MSESSNAISRREALKTTAKAAGAAAFVTPVIIGVFNSSASAAVCSTTADSDAVQASIIPANYEWNHNCGTPQGAPFGRYNGQNKNFTLNNGTGTVQIGASGTDNPPVESSYYVITPPAGFNSCSATFTVIGCDTVLSTSSAPVATNTGPLPFCSNACDPGKPAVQLRLQSVLCCPNPV